MKEHSYRVIALMAMPRLDSCKFLFQQVELEPDRVQVVQYIMPLFYRDNV